MIRFKMEVDNSLLEELPGNDLNIIMEYLTNILPSVEEDVYDMKVGRHRVYVERETKDLWTIYRIEKNEDTVTIK